MSLVLPLLLAVTAQPHPLDAVFAEFDPKGPGCAVAVVKDGKPIYERCFGMANLEYDVPIGPDTPFHVASVSKQFTAFAVMLLARERMLSLDDDVRRYLPELHDFGKTIRIRHLVAHTSGLRDQWELAILAGWRMQDLITQDDLLRLVFQQRQLNFDPAERHMYSNTGYTLLAEIVRRVSGRAFAAFCRERIFEPLGMKNTRFQVDVTDLVPGRAYSYWRDASGAWRLAPLSYSNYGATSLFTTAEDLIAWDRNLDDGRVGGVAVRDWMRERGVLSNGQPITYAGGLIVFKYRGLDAIEHAGGDAGFRSELLKFPAENLSIMILSNRAETQAPVLARRVADLVLEGRFPQAPTSAEAPPEVVTLEEADLDRCAGDYAFDNDTFVTIRRVGARLVARLDGGPRIELLPTSKSAFVAPAVGARIEFVLPRSGPAEKFVLIGSAGNRVASRTTLDWPTGGRLDALLGSYKSPELRVTYRVERANGGLVLVHPKGPTAMLPVLPDRYDTEYGAVTFQRRRGKVTGLRVDNSRIVGLEFERNGP